MSTNVLVIVPSEWTQVSIETMNQLINWNLSQFVELQGRSLSDLNMLLRPTGWLPEGQRVLDVFVINEQLFMKFEADLD